jgi:hypothetical protein
MCWHGLKSKSYIGRVRVRNKPGGLDCQDQSGLRFLDLSRCPLSKCQDFLDNQDVLFNSVKIESLNQAKYKNQDKSRFYSIDFVKICRDVIFQTVKNFSTVKMSFFKVLRMSQLSTLTFSKCRD